MSVLDPAKLAVISVIAMLVLGPQRVGQVARQLGSFWRTVSEHRERLESELHKTIDDLDLPDPRALRPSTSFHRAFDELSAQMPSRRSLEASLRVPRAASAPISSVLEFADKPGDVARPAPPRADGPAALDDVSMN